MKRILLLFAFFLLPASNVLATVAEDKFKEAQFYTDKTQQWYEAIRSLNEAIEADPSYWQAYDLLAYVYAKVGNKPKAIEAAQKSLDLHPDNPDLQKLLDQLNRQMVDASNAPKPSLLAHKKGELELAFMGGVAFNSRSLEAGPSFSLRGLYSLDEQFSVGFSSGFQAIDFNPLVIPIVPQTVTQTTYLRLSGLEEMASAKYRFFEQNGAQVYLLGGLGLAVMMSGGRIDVASSDPTIPNSSQDIPTLATVYPSLEVGIGFEASSYGQMESFLEMKADIVFETPAYAFLPINLGFAFDL